MRQRLLKLSRNHLETSVVINSGKLPELVEYGIKTFTFLLPLHKQVTGHEFVEMIEGYSDSPKTKEVIQAINNYLKGE